jgi:biotin carboxylase
VDAVAAAKKIGLPVIVKPVDSQASRGVAKIQEIDEIPKWFDKAKGHSRRGSVLIEELLVGIESSAEAFVSHQEIQLLGVCEKVKCYPPYSYDLRLTYPATFPASIVKEIISLNEMVIKALDIRMGLTHAEFIVTEKGVKLIEIAARGCGAGVATRLIPAMTGLDPIQARIRQAIGDDANLGKPRFQKWGILEYLMLPPGRVRTIQGLEEARKVTGILAAEYNIKVGDLIGVIENGDTRPGYLLAVEENRARLLQTIDEAKSKLVVEMETAP